MELMEKCRRLDECIEKGILLDILTNQRAEVFAVLLETFDKELYERDLRENIRAELMAEVKAEVREEAKKEQILELIRRKLEKGKSVEEIADVLEEDAETVKELMKEF